MQQLPRHPASVFNIRLHPFTHQQMSQVLLSNISVYSFPAFITVTSLPAAGDGSGDNGCLPASLAFPVLFTYCLTLNSLINDRLHYG